MHGLTHHSTAMPPIGKRKIVDGEIPNAFFLSYDAANALKKEKADLLAYIKSQESCPGSDKTVANKIVTEYESKSGGGAILSGLFDRRVHAWLAKRIKGHENWSLEAVVKLKLAEVRQLQSYWYADSILLNLLFLNDCYLGVSRD